MGTDVLEPAIYHEPTAAMRRWREPAETQAVVTTVPARRIAIMLEMGAAFVLGVLLMAFFYNDTGGPAGAEIGVPGHDSAYHVKMAAMIPEYGLVKTFPWLRFSYFTDEGHDFVSHHYGFHMLLLPFVHAAKWLTGDYLPGGRWAICTFFGVELALFYLLLVRGGVRWPWLWMALFLLMPHQFFTRHAFVRAISPSMVFMLLILLLAFRNRYLLAGFVVALYGHLYLGAVMYAPVLIATFAAASLFGPRGERRFPWRLVVCTAVGWGLGVVTYPYSEGMVEFLRLQVFGTGLTPDIEVGQEWKPYNGVWWFARMSAVVLVVWAAATAARLRFGPRLSAPELALLLLSVAFLVLTFKARRFIEYWPVFCLLSSAYLSAPLIGRVAAWIDGDGAGEGRHERWTRTALLVLAGVAAVGLGAVAVRNEATTDLFQSWQLWAAAGVPFAMLLLHPLLRDSQTAGRRIGRAARAAVAGCLLIAGTAYVGADEMQEVRRSTRCYYDLAAVRDMMIYLREHSERGDVIFTDDWDTFPIFFYHNAHNRYVVGLDPKFTHARRPDLWERFVKITRGQVPADSVVQLPVGGGEYAQHEMHIRLEDIREHFGAKFVITDRDHRALASKLYAARDFAELVYPSASFRATRDVPYRVFRVREPGEAFGPVNAEDIEFLDKGGILYLSLMHPTGETRPAVDRAADGGPLRVGGTRHLRGLGGQAPSAVRYGVPSGYDRFEATVGIDTDGAACGPVVVSVLLDGREVYASDPLTDGILTARMSIPLGEATVLELRAELAEVGTECDRVNWGSARFVRAPE